MKNYYLQGEKQFNGLASVNKIFFYWTQVKI